MSDQFSLDTRDRIFSRWIRLRAANRFGGVKCVTCNAVVPWKEIHCGHFINRGYTATRFDPMNCHPQCVACNIFKDGNLKIYAIYLEKLEPGLPDRLQNQADNGPVYEPNWGELKSEVKEMLEKTIST